MQFKTNKNMLSANQVSWQTRVIPALGKKAEGQGTRVSMNLKAEEGSRCLMMSGGCRQQMAESQREPSE